MHHTRTHTRTHRKLQTKPMPSLDRLDYGRSPKTTNTRQACCFSHTKNPSINHNIPARKKIKRQSSSKQHTVLHSSASVLKHGIKNRRTFNNTLNMYEASTTLEQEMDSNLQPSSCTATSIHIHPYTSTRHETQILLHDRRRSHRRNSTNMDRRTHA